MSLEVLIVPQVESVVDAVRADLWQRLTEADAQGPSKPQGPSLLEWATTNGERLVASTVAATAHNMEGGGHARGPSSHPGPATTGGCGVTV